jgi:triacylglycerol lipase
MQKPAPIYSSDLVFHPESDATYVHFENGSTNPFVANPPDFPRVNAWWMADSSLLTYWPPDQANLIFGSAGLQSTFLKVGSTDCYVASNSSFVLVAFRGTEPDEWSDVLTDVKIKLVPWTVGQVHRGFKEALDAIWPTLDAALAALPGRTVWFTGHSLGAALATLAADRFASTRGVCTFGCPRVGDPTFAAAFDAKFAGRSLRYVNNNDVVTHVPPPFGYEHVDARRFISSNGVVSNLPPSLAHFFAELIGPTVSLLQMMQSVMDHQLTATPKFILEHMPKAYGIWTWNDYDENG